MTRIGALPPFCQCLQVKVQSNTLSLPSLYSDFFSQKFTSSKLLYPSNVPLILASSFFESDCLKKQTTFNHLTFLPQELFFNRVANQKNIPPSFSYLQRSWFLSGFSLKTLELEAICASTNSGYHFQQRVSTDSSRIIYYLYTLEPKFMNDSHDQEMWGPGKSLPFGLSKIFLVLALRAPYPRKPLSAGQTVTIGHLSLERYLRVQAP